ncbi:hypothetical protein A3860_09600 [Niastella vici]|uniref:Uncharacterized protein n=1 Tax=Niastella vici TaxID=1703345 RepID=A0A1V9FEP4_9BACT|nr:hypothetical protein [Niastella vici]OQP56829.1 hypothetical protein A3860_09600 [Niastella vici]
MLHYKKYLVKNTDQFDPEFFSFVGNDVDLIKEEIQHIVCDYKAEFIVYFLKDHCLPGDWEKANPEFVALVKSKSLSSGNIELLFESCYNNPVFKQQLETYIKGKMAEKYV